MTPPSCGCCSVSPPARETWHVTRGACPQHAELMSSSTNVPETKISCCVVGCVCYKVAEAFRYYCVMCMPRSICWNQSIKKPLIKNININKGSKVVATPYIIINWCRLLHWSQSPHTNCIGVEIRRGKNIISVICHDDRSTSLRCKTVKSELKEWFHWLSDLDIFWWILSVDRKIGQGKFWIWSPPTGKQLQYDQSASPCRVWRWPAV